MIYLIDSASPEPGPIRKLQRTASDITRSRRTKRDSDDVIVCFVSGPPPPLAFLPPPQTWPLFAAVSAPGDKVMAKNVNGSGRKQYAVLDYRMLGPEIYY